MRSAGGIGVRLHVVGRHEQRPLDRSGVRGRPVGHEAAGEGVRDEDHRRG